MSKVTTAVLKLNKALPLGLSLLFSNAVCAITVEEIPANEDAATRQIVQMIEEAVRSDASKNGLALRDAHAKSHGCVKAEFKVLDNLPEKLRVGIFSEPRTFPAWIRYSNGSGKSQNDADRDARGMAIKLMGVERSESGTQDYLMINHPVFFVRNAADYVEFQKAVTRDLPILFFFPGFNPLNLRIHELAIANTIRNTKLVNPLHSQYWSTTPYLFGDNTAVKFSARPCNSDLTGNEKSSSPNFLRENMQKQLAKGEACFDFMVQLRTHPSEMPIEDPTIAWNEEIAPFTRVALITIPKQQFIAPEQVAYCENLSFTPWHSTPEHKPLGGINRVRKTVYDTVSRVRHEINGDQHLEATPVDPIFKQ